ncbi:DUF1311 domain-containing protein [Desulforhopalus vacuolatus]|uniref:lysozyme inhibitor LprI family protein n=1 Tax=Desulforhopalus vacuolatus TaxID=40414 RepID=UPI0019659DD3|nr:lysozyme inhibitor LprI family protein [Desulforhopalus vacuolatus]MBM9518469.1 DUF1311 domain-containing protein [Desulforhopalus vacuolatus]
MKYIITLLLIFFCNIAEATDKNAWPDTSAMYAGLSQKEILDKKNSKIEALTLKISEELEKNMPDNGRVLADLFTDNQTKWHDYVDSTCMLIGQATGAGGSWPSYYALKCTTNMADQRIFNLVNSLQCIKRHTRNKNYYDIPLCLYQSYSIEY